MEALLNLGAGGSPCWAVDEPWTAPEMRLPRSKILRSRLILEEDIQGPRRCLACL